MSGYQHLESRDATGYISHLEEEGRGLRAQLERFGTRVSFVSPQCYRFWVDQGPHMFDRCSPRHLTSFSYSTYQQVCVHFRSRRCVFNEFHLNFIACEKLHVAMVLLDTLRVKSSIVFRTGASIREKHQSNAKVRSSGV